MLIKTQDSKVYLKSILENVVDGLITIDEAGIIHSFNRAAEEIFGYTEEEMLGRNVSSLMPESEAVKHDGYLKAYLKSRNAKIIGIGREVVGLRKNGTEFPMDLSVSEMVIGDHRFFSGIVRDYTEKNKKEMMLDQLGRLNELILNSAGEGICGLDLEGKITFANPVAAKMLGYAPEELSKKPIHELICHSRADGKPFPFEENKIIAALRSGETHKDSVGTFWRKNGTGFPVEYIVTPIIEEGDILGAVVTFRDIFVRQRMEEALQKSEAMHRAIFANAGVPLSIMDDTFRFSRFNSIWCDLLGYSGEELRARTPMDILHPEDRDVFSKEIKALRLGEKESCRITLRVLDKNGKQYWLDWSIAPLKDPAGLIYSYICITPDITQQKLANIEMRRVRDEALKASEAKTHFLARMSHELRTPLNAILGFGQLLTLNQADNLSPSQKAGIKEIMKSGSHLLELINEVLDLTRIETGESLKHLEEVPLMTLLRDLVLLTQPKGYERGISISIESSLPEDCKVVSNLMLLKTVLLNLISNAVKYNREEGKVLISAMLIGENVRILVEDTGIGIPEQEREAVFEPFNRGQAEKLEIEGAGMGLAIAKKAAEDLGGTLVLESEVDKGSQFTFEFPQGDPKLLEVKEDERGPVNMKADMNKINQAKKTVLYIEDNVANQELIVNLFKQVTNHNLVLAKSAMEGLELAEELHPDLILLDINMPEMDGFGVKAELDRKKSTQSIPVIGLSAHALDEYKSRALAAGFQSYITKPINIQEFLRIINSTLNGDASG